MSRALHGEGAPDAAVRGEHARHVLCQQRYLPPPSRQGDAEAPGLAAHCVFQRERGNCTANAYRMQFPMLRSQGLPVAGGAVEGATKHLVQQRMQRAGLRWSERGSRAILRLRCATLTDLPRAT